MRLMSCAIWVACSLLLFFEESYGGDNGLRVSAKDGVISITSTKSTLPEIMARLSRELGMTINVYGASETDVVPCSIQNASLWDTLHKLVPEWDAMTFSRTNRSAEVWLKGVPAGKGTASAPAAAVPQPAAPEPEPAAAEPATSEPEPVVDENAQQTDGTVFSGEETSTAAPDQAPPREQESHAVDGQSPEAEQNAGGAQEETVVVPDQPPIPEGAAPVTGEEIVQDAVVQENEDEARKMEGGEHVPQRQPSSRGRWRTW